MISKQDTLFEVTPVAAQGIVYLMTDGYKIKWGWSSRSTPKARSGELRADVIGFMSGTRADEAAYQRHFKRWCIGGEWFSIPNETEALDDLLLLAPGMGQWKGIPARKSLARVIANNLRRAA